MTIIINRSRTTQILVQFKKSSEDKKPLLDSDAVHVIVPRMNEIELHACGKAF